MLNGSATAQDIALSPRSQQRGEAEAVARATYETDKEYDKNTLAAPVVLYDTGRDGTAQLPSIRALNPDKATGEWRLLTKDGKTLMDFRGHVVGVHARGWGADMWGLTAEQAAKFDHFEWLLAPGSYERVLRGCATNCDGGLATLRTQQARVLAVTHLLEMMHTPDALALKGRLVAYWRFLDEFRIANQPHAAEEPVVEKPVSTKRTASAVLAGMNADDERDVKGQAAKRSRGSPVPSDASSVSSADTVESGDVAAVQHTPGLSDVEAQRYVKAVLAHIAEARDISMPAVFEMLTEARELAEANPAEDHGNGDHPDAAYDEVLRVAVRAMLVKDHSFRMAFAQLNDGIRAAMDHGCEAGQTKGFEGLRNDIGHTAFDKGDYRIVFGEDGACDWHLARTNKKGTADYTQDIRAACPDLADFLADYRPIAYAMRPPGHDAAPVLCCTAGQKQDEIGRMLSVAHGTRANKAGFCDDSVSERRKGFRKKYNKAHPESQISEKCKPRHVLRRLRDGTPAQRAVADRARDSGNRNYGTGSTEQGAAAAAAASMGCV